MRQKGKQRLLDFWQLLQEAPPNSLPSSGRLEHHLHTDVAWRGNEPLTPSRGISKYLQNFWLPFRRSFPELKRETFIFMGGYSSGRVNAPRANPLNDPEDGQLWIAGTGLWHAVFENDYLGIPASGQDVSIRWGEFYRVENDRICEIFLMIDLLDLALQCGHHLLPPSAGKEGIYLPPAAGDGIMLQAQDHSQSDESLDHIRRFIFDGLDQFDQENLESMGMANWFHPKLKWYGPCGIGACLSFAEFESLHQKPWLRAFPDRHSGDLDALIGEGEYTAFTGFDGMTATHTGPYLGYPPSAQSLRISGLDFWKREGDVLIENWVFVDMIGLFRQIGVDLLSLIRR